MAGRIAELSNARRFHHRHHRPAHNTAAECSGRQRRSSGAGRTRSRQPTLAADAARFIRHSIEYQPSFPFCLLLCGCRLQLSAAHFEPAPKRAAQFVAVPHCALHQTHGVCGGARALSAHTAVRAAQGRAWVVMCGVVMRCVVVL
jgi:hypothetical protein